MFRTNATYTKKLSVVFLAIILLAILTSTANAKTVYAIIDHGYRYGDSVSAKIAAYDIQEDQIDFQVVNEMDQQVYPTGAGLGPVGLAVDSESEYLFVTHESMDGSGVIKGIQLINAKTMVDEGLC